MGNDTFLTIAAETTAVYTEKRSKFIAYAVPISAVEDAMARLETLRKNHYDARHVCYAYRLGATGEVFRANDNGEPSGTAGKPILGQIRSAELTDVLVAVVRYFGGIKLGTGGLTVAYKTAAAAALAEAAIVEKTIDDTLTVAFAFAALNEVMRIVKDENATINDQRYDTECHMTLRIRRSQYARLCERLRTVVREMDGKSA
jgi:uncharacterized YigZ family protein